MKKLLKKMISVSLATMMSIMAVPITQDTVAFAIPSTLRTKVNVENVTIGPSDAGSEIQIPIKIENLSAAGDNPNLKNCTLELQYSDELTFNDKEKGMMRFTDFYDNKSSHILEINASSDTTINEDGVLFTLSFMLPESLENSTGYDITINNCELTNEDGDEISSSNSDGYIEYKESKETAETFYQENPIEIAVESAEIPAMAGEEISVPVTISNNVGIAGSMFSFEYDSRLKYLDTSWDIINGTDVVNETTSADGMNILTITSANAANTAEEGMLFSLNFEVPEDVKEGDIYCINVVNCSLYDDGSHDLKFVTKNAKLTARDNKLLPDPTEAVVETTEPETTNNIVTKPVTKKDDPDSLSVGTVVEYDDAGGKKVDVPVYIENNSGFASAAVIFKYDSRLTVNPADLKLSSDINGIFNPIVNEYEDTITIISTIDSNVKKDGNVFWLSFTLPDNAKVGDFYPIKIDEIVWQHVIEKSEDGYKRGSTTYKDLTVKTYDGGISVEKTPIVTTSKPAETITPIITTITAKKAIEEERHTVPIHPFSLSSKNVISIQKKYVSPEDAGKKIKIPVYISQNEGFASAGFVISYDKRLVVSNDDIETTKYLNSKGTVSSFAFDNIKTISIAFAGNKNVTENATFCNILFSLPSDAQPNDEYIIEIKEVHNWDHLIESNEEGYEYGFKKMKELPISKIDGAIVVAGDGKIASDNNKKFDDDYNSKQDDTSISSTPGTEKYTDLLGDANLDKTVDTKDAILVLKEYAKSITDNNHKTVLKINADVNFDKKYDSADAVFILQYYAAVVLGYKEKMDPFMADKGYEKA